MIDYKDELDDILMCDPQLAKEIDYDIREYNKQLQKQSQKSANGTPGRPSYPSLTPGKTPLGPTVCALHLLCGLF